MKYFGFLHRITDRDKFVWSGRGDSNPRLFAWEANTLPLSYTRIPEGRRLASYMQEDVLNPVGGHGLGLSRQHVGHDALGSHRMAAQTPGSEEATRTVPLSAIATYLVVVMISAEGGTEAVENYPVALCGIDPGLFYLADEA